MSILKTDEKYLMRDIFLMRRRTMKKYILVIVLCTITAMGKIFAQVPQEELWKNKVFYVGGSAGLGPIFGPDGTVLGGNLSLPQFNWQIKPFLALGTGLNFYFAPKTYYTAPKQTDPDSGILETYAGLETHILFPLFLEFTYRPSIFSIEVGGGLYAAHVTMNTTVERTNDNGYTVSEGYGKDLFKAERNNPFGFIARAGFGVNVGPGILFLDTRYLLDFSEITVKFRDEKAGYHHWNMLAFNLGYTYGFMLK